MTGEHMPDEQVDVTEVYQAMDELGRAKFDAALAQVRMASMAKRIAELENQQTAAAAESNGKAPVGSGRA